MPIYTNEHLTDLLNEQYEKVRELEKKLNEAIEVISFYSNKDNWTYYDIHSWGINQSSISSSDSEILEGVFGKVGTKYFGGKRARAFLATLNEVRE